MKNCIVILPAVICLLCCSSPQDPKAKQEKENTVHSAYRVSIEQMKFIPAGLSVNKGDTVIWTNNDLVDHNVTEEKKGAWFSPILSNGKSWRMVVQEDADYFCSIHKVMKGKLTVHKQR